MRIIWQSWQLLIAYECNKGFIGKYKHTVQSPPARARTLFTIVILNDMDVGRPACCRKYVELARRLFPLRTWEQ